VEDGDVGSRSIVDDTRGLRLHFVWNCSTSMILYHQRHLSAGEAVC
jgi:hypothetical protein